MDLESELRQAMTEHVASASAPSSLVTAVHRRHRRRAARIRATVAVAAVAAIAIVVVPVRHAVRATPAGEPDGPSGGPATVSTTPMPPLATPYPRSAAPDGAGRTSGSNTAPPARGSSRRDPLRALVTYLPSGLRPEGLCAVAQAAGRSTTTCRWAGDGGAALEVRLVRDPALSGPEDIAAASAPVLAYDQVHHQPAIVTAQTGVGRQVTWIERPGLGILVSVSTPLGDRLMRIADGVRP